MSASESPSKKHKKHKKHKHKKHRPDNDEDIDVGLDYLDVSVGGEDAEEDIDVLSPPPAIKLKIRLGGETMGTSSVQASEDVPVPTEEGGTVVSVWAEGNVRGEDIFLTKKPGDDTSDEEREWLDALEAGTLDDSGALKKRLDPSLMTARQRARISGKPEEPMMQLPTGYKTTELTEEQLQRRQLRAKKRREQAMEKEEKDKKQTLDRLLKKQQAKMKGGKNKAKRSHHPAYRYTSCQALTGISVPQGYQFPFPAQGPKRPPEPSLCGVSGCRNLKKYNCSKTGIPLCSLECYKTNFTSLHSSSVVSPT